MLSASSFAGQVKSASDIMKNNIKIAITCRYEEAIGRFPIATPPRTTTNVEVVSSYKANDWKGLI